LKRSKLETGACQRRLLLKKYESKDLALGSQFDYYPMEKKNKKVGGTYKYTKHRQVREYCSNVLPGLKDSVR
jgi:hypothetical protein